MLCPKKNYTREMLTKKIPALENFSPTLSPPPPPLPINFLMVCPLGD